MNVYTEKRGASVLIAVLIMSSALVLIAFTSISQSISDIDLSFHSAKSAEALALAEGCIEETLRRWKINPSYGVGAGQIVLTLANGSCTIEITDLGGGTRDVKSTATSGPATKQVTARMGISSSPFTILSWRET